MTISEILDCLDRDIPKTEQLKPDYRDNLVAIDLKDYTEGILFKHIQNSEIVFHAMQLSQQENLSEVEELRLIVNMLAEENSILKQMNINLISRMPSRDFSEMITGKN